MDNLRNKFDNINDYINNSKPFQFYAISNTSVGSDRIIEMLYHNSNNEFEYLKDRIANNLCYPMKKIKDINKRNIIETLKNNEIEV